MGSHAAQHGMHGVPAYDVLNHCCANEHLTWRHETADSVGSGWQLGRRKSRTAEAVTPHAADAAEPGPEKEVIALSRQRRVGDAAQHVRRQRRQRGRSGHGDA